MFRNMGKLDELIDKSNDILMLLDVEIVDNDYFKDYEPDSSKAAWKYYEIMYKDTINIKASIERKGGGKYRRERGYFKYEKENNKVIEQIPEQGYLEIGKISLAGDCVFNFNEKKFNIFKKFVKGDIELLGKLLYCHKMHHSPYNFALIPVSGGMNNKKGSHNDRPDWLLYSLSKFCETLEEKRGEIVYNKDCIIADIDKDGIRAKDISNKDDVKDQIYNMQQSGYEIMQKNHYTPINLYHFLAQIKTAEAYADLFYHLTQDNKDEKKLVCDMIALGKKPIDGRDKLIAYMDLAVRYWEIQRKKYR